MVDKYYKKNGGLIQLNFTVVEVAFIILFLSTLLNSFFNSLYIAYGHTSIYASTFLFDPADLHGDLVKYVLSFFHGKFPDYQNWKPLYQEYYIHNPYGGAEALKNGSLSSFGSFPMSVLLCLGLGSLIYLGGPTLLIVFFYIFVIVSLVATVYFFTREKSPSTFYLSLAILMSYPVLFILTRGHIYSFITGTLAIFFIFSVLTKRSILIPVILLAIMINLRPNMLILGILFYVYGFKDSIKGLILVGISGSVLFAISLLIATSILDGYTFENIVVGLKTYSSMYIIGDGGNAFNNSLFGCLKVGGKLIHLNLSESTLLFINKLTSFSLFALLPLGMYLYHRKRLSGYDLAFLVVSVYVLASPVTPIYHMFIFFAFMLFGLRSDSTFDSSYSAIILIVAVFVLSPKNYIFTHGVSFEVILNPLVMLTALLYIVSKACRSELTDSRRIMSK